MERDRRLYEGNRNLGLPRNSMPYEHAGGWKLYSREVKLKRGPKVTIYFFSKRKPKSGKQADMPPGRKVIVNKRTGLPFLKGKGK